MVAMDDERELIVRSQNGDHEAFAALIREHQRMIRSLCYGMSGSSADADDLAVLKCRPHVQTRSYMAIPLTDPAPRELRTLSLVATTLAYIMAIFESLDKTA